MCNIDTITLFATLSIQNQRKEAGSRQMKSYYEDVEGEKERPHCCAAKYSGISTKKSELFIIKAQIALINLPSALMTLM